MYLTTTREQLLQKQADDLALFDREAALAARFPGTPKAVHGWRRSAPWATYEAPTLAAGIEMLRGFAADYVPCAVVKAGCTSIDAVELLDAEYRKHRDEKGAAFDFSGPYAVCESFGRGHASAKVHAFIKLTDGTIGRVTIEQPILSSPPPALWIRSSVSYNNHGEITQAKHDLPSIGEGYRVNYGGGGRDAAHIVLLFKTPADFFDKVKG